MNSADIRERSVGRTGDLTGCGCHGRNSFTTDRESLVKLLTLMG
ncbi:MAG: hypothetical protein R3B91_15890 [Planctomycetaceae bacterium]